jgi:hypothetical protein
MAPCYAKGSFVEIGGGAKFDSLMGGWWSKQVVGNF